MNRGKGSVGYYQAYQHIRMGDPEGEDREKEGEKLYEDKIVKNIPNSTKYIKINI